MVENIADLTNSGKDTIAGPQGEADLKTFDALVIGKEKLLGIGAQFGPGPASCGDRNEDGAVSPASAEGHRIMPSTSKDRDETHCIYHAQAIEGGAGGDLSRNQLPLERFEEEGVSEQSSLFWGPGDGKLSIDKGCTCGGSNNIRIEMVDEGVKVVYR